ncbi:hypothetical protein EXIGLDRAFT_760938 [Exidia glandulosa HHB12029]|uniref:C2H2-type domain-containing protein n=1 Tax=Exidia glandulosa HHB12029 TaxID=1314781 RepID=A0A165NSU9_EXIGL|nr:hypothetical protein EXIGLDRAFT_760938 [Exidia glandulosa HHB12029]
MDNSNYDTPNQLELDPFMHSFDPNWDYSNSGLGFFSSLPIDTSAPSFHDLAANYTPSFSAFPLPLLEFGDISPASSTSSIGFDSSSPITPPASECDLANALIVTPGFETHTDEMHLDHVVVKSEELPPLTLGALGLYLHVGHRELSVLSIAPRRSVVRHASRRRLSGPGPIRSEKVSKRAQQDRLRTITNLPAKPRAGKVKVKVESHGEWECNDCHKTYKSDVMLREHLVFSLTHDDMKADDELPTVRWVCPVHGRPFTVPTSLQRHCVGNDMCNAELIDWCKSVGITREEYLSLNYDKEFCSPVKFEPRTDPRWKRRLEVTLRRGGCKHTLEDDGDVDIADSS